MAGAGGQGAAEKGHQGKGAGARTNRHALGYTGFCGFLAEKLAFRSFLGPFGLASLRQISRVDRG
jgi:hypothetical protein